MPFLQRNYMPHIDHVPQELQEEAEIKSAGEPSSAARAAASTKVSLSEPEEETLATLAYIAYSFETQVGPATPK